MFQDWLFLSKKPEISKKKNCQEYYLLCEYPSLYMFKSYLVSEIMLQSPYICFFSKKHQKSARYAQNIELLSHDARFSTRSTRLHDTSSHHNVALAPHFQYLKQLFQ